MLIFQIKILQINVLKEQLKILIIIWNIIMLIIHYQMIFININYIMLKRMDSQNRIILVNYLLNLNNII